MSKPQRDRARDEAHCRACGSPACSWVDVVGETFTHRREEITAQGFDDFRQLSVPGTGADPLGWPGSTGLRVPEFPATSAYRFLLAVADLDDGDMVVGIRQGLELGAIIASLSDAGNPVPPMYAELRPVVTYNWHFNDSAWAWTLTREPLRPWRYRAGPNDSDSFAFEDAMTPALLYASAGFPAAPVFPGYLGLNAYTPPAIRGNKVLVARDLRWPFDSPQTNEELWMPVGRPERWRLYCDVYQTDASTRTQPTFANGTDVRQIRGLVPEEEFLFYLAAQTAVAQGPYVWRVHGRLIIDRRMRKGA